MARLAGVAPVHCSSCFQQDPSRRHVDFEASYDGPVFAEGAAKVAIDDLIICEECLRNGARLLGLVDPDGTAQERDRLLATNQRLADQITTLERSLRDERRARQAAESLLPFYEAKRMPVVKK